MPTTAQDRTGRGPLGALLILLSLLLSSGAAAAAGGDLRGPVARPGAVRTGPGSAILAAGTRNPLDDELAGDGPAVPPSEAGPVTRGLWARPLADVPSGDRLPLPQAAFASYRARAPPAS
ncbi:MAG TPA: hypothetical protein VEW26_06805 [Allosphingosinicella sp.]|nr:hypothetical protein [Allosphingosinicella sp.]